MEQISFYLFHTIIKKKFLSTSTFIISKKKIYHWEFINILFIKSYKISRIHIIFWAKNQHLSLAANADVKKTSNARRQWSFLFFFVFGQTGVGVELAERFQPGVEHVVDNRGDVVEFVRVRLRVKKVNGKRRLERLRPGDAGNVEAVEVNFPRVENNAGIDFFLRLFDVDGVVLLP